ncbi:MAG: aminotransferase class V-fold PLP-dependent enzyme [Candidatus Marinimicrobia bacterium]|jgi:isopenicillin-N epimerase|nr:aminotransferase class V-fold PLP-dependent enzyme [Candidatus Neomarinimicrobiota bacterium]
MNGMKDWFLLDPDITFLNHGSYGACSKPVFKEYQDWQKKLEDQPVQFMTNQVYSAMEKSRESMSQFVECDEEELVFFQNPTTAVTNVIYNLDLKPGDEVLMSNHEYGALVRAWKMWGEKTGVNIIQQDISMPLTTKKNFIENFWTGVTDQTKVIFLSHITSSTALIFPIEKIIKLAKEQNILTIIDGAHVPAHIPLNIHELGCDFYTGACHKWLCAPKGSSFLFVKKEHQDWVKPVVVSWGKDGDDPSPSEFIQNFQWQGTRDMSAFLTIPTAINFYIKEIRPYQESCKKIIQDTYSEFPSVLNTEPISAGREWLAQLVAHPLPKNIPSNLKKRLWKEYQIEIPVFEWSGQEFVRVSIQVYNTQKDVDLLMSALRSLI